MTQATEQTTKSPKKKSKLVSNIVCGVIAALLLIGAIIFFAGRAQNRVVFVGGKAMIWIMTPSMHPLIEEQSYIQIEKITADDVAVGDIITFYSDDPAIKDKLNTHKVVEIKGEGDAREFVTKGINNPVEDAYTAKADRVVGRYVQNLSTMTALMRFFLTKAGLLVVLLAIVALTLVLCLPDFLTYSRERRAKALAEKQAEERRLIDAEIERLRQQQSQANPPDSETDPEAFSSEKSDRND